MITALPGVSLAKRATARPAIRPPVAPPAIDDVAPAPRPAWSVQRRLRVLAVDERALVGAQIARMLPAHDVTSVISADAAVAALTALPLVDVILYSAAMPGLSGLAFADLLAVQQPSLRARLVFLFDRAPSAVMLDKLEHAGIRWVTKPLHYALLATAVDAAAGAPLATVPDLALSAPTLASAA